jgi:hypothetical protein
MLDRRGEKHRVGSIRVVGSEQTRRSTTATIAPASAPTRISDECVGPQSERRFDGNSVCQRGNRVPTNRVRRDVPWPRWTQGGDHVSTTQ